MKTNNLQLRKKTAADYRSIEELTREAFERKGGVLSHGAALFERAALVYGLEFHYF